MKRIFFLRRLGPGLLLGVLVCTLPPDFPRNLWPALPANKMDPNTPLNLAPLPAIEPRAVKQAGHSDYEHYYDQVSFLQQQLAESDDRHKILLKRLE